LIWINGELVPPDKARLDPRDRGYTLGDGLFETMRASGGSVPLIEGHLERLRAGAAEIGLPLSWEDDELKEAVAETLAAGGLAGAAVRLTVSRGVPGQRGLLPDPEPRLSLVIQAHPFSGYPHHLCKRGMRAVTSTIPRNEHSPLANIKSLSYLENVLARREATRRGADEALLRNTAGDLVCASAANLFLVLGNELVTPDLASGALPGTMRHLVLAKLAPRLGLSASERAVRPEELEVAGEAFLTSALLGVMPLTAVDGCPVGAGAPGPVSLALGPELERLREVAGGEV
jgi:branched-chain amino acid aminotransferase